MMTRRSPAAVLAAVLLLVACTTTTFTSTWKAPEVQGVSPAGKTIAAVFITRDEARRRAGEDALAADLRARGATVITSYSLLPNAHPQDSEAAREALKQAGATAAVMMRVVGHDKEITYTPGYVAPMPYRGFGPYWGYGWGAVYDPGYLRTDTIISLETLVYSLKYDKLLWASTSRTTNPSNIDALVKEVADATAKQMVKQGFLAP